jgi:hypothetical protein
LDNFSADKTSLLGNGNYPTKPSPLKIANPLAILVKTSRLLSKSQILLRFWLRQAASSQIRESSREFGKTCKELTKLYAEITEVANIVGR